MKTAATMKTMARAQFCDMQQAACDLGRFEFIALFVARMTKTADKRIPVDGMKVRVAGEGWIYSYAGLDSVQTPIDAHKLFECIRRGPLNYYVQQAEDFRASVLS